MYLRLGENSKKRCSPAETPERSVPLQAPSRITIKLHLNPHARQLHHNTHSTHPGRPQDLTHTRPPQHYPNSPLRSLARTTMLRSSPLLRQLGSRTAPRCHAATLPSLASQLAYRCQSTQQAQQQTRKAHAISNPTLANIEKRWEGMPPQEQADLWMALRDRMKVDWNELTMQEKKAGKLTCS